MGCRNIENWSFENLWRVTDQCSLQKCEMCSFNSDFSCIQVVSWTITRSWLCQMILIFLVFVSRKMCLFITCQWIEAFFNTSSMVANEQYASSLLSVISTSCILSDKLEKYQFLNLYQLPLMIHADTYSCVNTDLVFQYSSVARIQPSTFILSISQCTPVIKNKMASRWRFVNFSHEFQVWRCMPPSATFQCESQNSTYLVLSSALTTHEWDTIRDAHFIISSLSLSFGSVRYLVYPNYVPSLLSVFAQLALILHVLASPLIFRDVCELVSDATFPWFIKYSR